MLAGHQLRHDPRRGRYFKPSDCTVTKPTMFSTGRKCFMHMRVVCHHLKVEAGGACAGSRIRPSTMAAGDLLHDMGAVSMVARTGARPRMPSPRWKATWCSQRGVHDAANLEAFRRGRPHAAGLSSAGLAAAATTGYDSMALDVVLSGHGNGERHPSSAHRRRSSRPFD